jgi:hypothetical protein
MAKRKKSSNSFITSIFKIILFSLLVLFAGYGLFWFFYNLDLNNFNKVLQPPKINKPNPIFKSKPPENYSKKDKKVLEGVIDKALAQ